MFADRITLLYFESAPGAVTNSSVPATLLPVRVRPAQRMCALFILLDTVKFHFRAVVPIYIPVSAV